MVYRPRVDQKLCFVLMPFSQPFDSYYDLIIKPAASDAGLAALRSDEIRGRRAIVKDIWGQIWAARIVVADVTGQNPNVNYELGLCDALGVPTIIITGNIADVPFDYKHRRCIVYNRLDAGWDDQLRKNLAETMLVILAETPDEDELEWPYDTGRLSEPASAGVLVATADFRKVVIQGAMLVRDAIASAFGPRGAAVAISQPFGSTRNLQRGVQIAHGIKSSSPLEEKGIEQIRIAASTIDDMVGDSTKLVSILAAGFMAKGQELIDKGFHPKDVFLSMEQAVGRVSKHLARMARPVTGNGVFALATTAALGDGRIGNLVNEAIKRAGPNGVITIESTPKVESFLELREGLKFDRGYLSDYFLTNNETFECVLENCLVLAFQGRIQSMRDLLPLLEQVAKSDKSLLIIADDVEGEALSTLTVNKLRGTLRCAAVRAPGEGERRKALMEDIAVITGGTFLNAELGVPLSAVALKDLGKAEKVVVKHDDTTIVGGAGASEAVQDRIRSIQAQISVTSSSFERERLQERLARMAGSVAVLRAGGLSEHEVAQEKYKLQSAMFAARAGIEDGGIVGGGIALLRAGLASLAIRAEPQVVSELETSAAQAVASVLEEPTRQLIENAKKSPTQVLAEILKSNSECWGFNAERCQTEDLLLAGVLDAVKAIDLSLKVAISHAGSVLQTGTWDLSPPPTQLQRPGQFQP
jgi:chaperonin GroEL